MVRCRLTEESTLSHRYRRPKRLAGTKGTKSYEESQARALTAISPIRLASTIGLWHQLQDINSTLQVNNDCCILSCPLRILARFTFATSSAGSRVIRHLQCHLDRLQGRHQVDIQHLERGLEPFISPRYTGNGSRVRTACSRAVWYHCYSPRICQLSPKLQIAGPRISARSSPCKHVVSPPLIWSPQP